MAHSWMTVCLSPDSADLQGSLAAALAPFQMWGAYPVDRFKWDHYRIAGGHNGAGFWIRAGYEHDPRLVHDQPRFGGEEQPSLPWRCAGGPLRLLDLRRPFLEAETEATAAWHEWQRLAGTLPPARPVSAYRDEHTGAWQNAVDAYWAQPLLVEFRRARLVPETYEWEYQNHLIADEGLESLLRWRRERARRRTGLVTVDGWWWEPHESATHGLCTDCPHQLDLSAWDDDVTGYLVGLPVDTIVVTVYCHC